MSNNLNAIYGASKVHERTLPNVYYVDLEAVTNGTGTMTSPYNTLSAITFASNMTVKLKRGTTATLSSGINISNLTNFVLSSYGEGLKPVLSFTHSGNYLIRLNNCTNSAITSIDFTTPFTEGGSQAVGCGIALGSGTDFLGGTGNIIANCKVSNIYNATSVGGIGIRGGGTNQIVYCEVAETGDDGMYLRDCPNTLVRGCYVHHVNQNYGKNANLLTGALGDGIQFDGNYDGCLVSENTILRDDEYTGNKFCIIFNSGNAAAANYTCIVERNYFKTNSHVAYAIDHVRGTEFIFRNNYFAGPTVGIRLEHGLVTNTSIYGNIFDTCDEAIKIGHGTVGNPPESPAAGTKVYNNLFYESTGDGDVTLDRSDVDFVNNISYNSNPTHPAIYVYGSGTIVRKSNNCYYGCISGYGGDGTNAIFDDPLFNDYFTKDFTLKANSPCLETGIDVGITVDYAGGYDSHSIGPYSKAKTIKVNNDSENTITVKLTFESAPNLEVNKAPLLYDKKFALGMRFDDTYRSQYTNSMAVFLGKDFASDENNVEHDGFRFSDGCGFTFPYVADFAAQAHALNTGGLEYISWADLNIAKDHGYSVLPQGAYVTYSPGVVFDGNGNELSHSPYLEWYNDFVEYRQLIYQNLGFRPFVVTSDIGYSYWASIDDNGIQKAPFFDAGFSFITTNDNPKKIGENLEYNNTTLGLDLNSITKETFNTGKPYPSLYHSKRILEVSELPPTGELYYLYQLPDYTKYRWDGSQFNITTESTAGSVPLATIQQRITDGINDSAARACVIFTHRIDYTESQNDNGGMYLPYFKSIFEWLDNNYGLNGTDEILVISANSVIEYVYCREFSDVSYTIKGTEATIKVKVPTNENLRRPALTLKINSNANISNIEVSGLDHYSENLVGNDSGILNLEWGQEYYSNADRYTSAAESERTQSSIDKANYFISYLTDPIKKTALENRINAIDVILETRYLLDFSRSFYPSSNPPFNNIEAPGSDLTLWTPTNISLRDVGNSGHGLKLSIVNAFNNMSYDGVNLGDDSGIYPDSAMRDSFNVLSGETAIMKLSGLNPFELVNFKFFGSRTTVTGIVTTYGVKNDLVTPTFYKTIEQDATNNSTETVFINHGYANSLGEIFIEVTSNTANSGRISVLEFETTSVTYDSNLLITDLILNGGAPSTSYLQVEAQITHTGTPTHYRISDNPDALESLIWSEYTSDTVNFTVSEGNGLKTLYIQIKNGTAESNIYYNSIEYASGVKVVVAFTANSSSITNVNGELINFINWNRYESAPNQYVQDTDGIVRGYFARKPSEHPVETWLKTPASVTSYNPIPTGDLGVYPDICYTRYMYPNNANVVGNMSLMRFLQFAEGTYTVRVYESTRLDVPLDKQPTGYYKIGIGGTPGQRTSPQPLNNTDLYTEITGTVGSDGILDIYFYNTGGQYSFPGITILEIIK